MANNSGMSTIDEVLLQLEQIIHAAIDNNDRAGYFAALYYKVTARVKEGIIEDEFEDAKRMERLDVKFAQRYINAYNGWKAGTTISESWKVAFESTKKAGALTLQHLLLGINAHINLDLGIAATEAIDNNDLRGIYKDFKAINGIISALTYGVINDLRRISPLLSILGLRTSNANSMLIQFSISSARDGAWCFAEELVEKTGLDHKKCIESRDMQISLLGKDIVSAKGLMKFTIWVIHLFEKKKVGRNVEIMHTHKKMQWHEVKQLNSTKQ